MWRFLVLSCLVAFTQANGGFETCDQQAACMEISKEKLTSTLCGADAACDIQVCILLHF